MKLELGRVSLATPSARSARRSWPERERLLVRVSDDAAFGLGEAAPLPGYSRESLDDAERELALVRATGLATPASASDWRAIAACVPDNAPAARFALETALVDYSARRSGVALPLVLGAAPEARVSVSCLVGAASEGTLLERAQAALRSGYRDLKVKVGAPERLRDELSGLSRLRNAVGGAVRLRLDANGAWRAEDLSQAWPMLREIGIDFFEEPGAMPDGLFGELPLALDESLQGLAPDAIDAVVARTAARAVVLKPTALGGLAHCLAVAQRVRERGVFVIVSHCFEGSIGLRAVGALALAIGGGAAHGIAPYDGATLPVQNGELSVWSEPGLGAPDDEALW